MPKVELDGTLGAALIGGLFACVLYGVTSVQTFIYFQNTHKDGRLFKAIIFWLWVLDTLHIAFTAHGIYFYLVTNFGNFVVLEAPTWSIIAGVYVTNLSDITVRSLFARRVFRLCGPSKRITRVALPVVIIVLSIVVFATGTGFASKAFMLVTFQRLDRISYLLYTSFAAGALADTLVAISLCTLLFNSRTGIRRTDSLLRILMAFSINTGLLTSICAMACLVTYAVWPQRFIFMGLYFALSKLYVNSLLASLNARQSLQKRDVAEPTSFDAVRTPIVFPMHTSTNGTGAMTFSGSGKESDTFQLAETATATTTTR